MQTTLTKLFPYIAAGVSWLIIILGVAMLTCIMVYFTYFWYQKMLRHVAWKGWYYSMCLLISDMARGNAKWHPAHVTKVASLLCGLRDENPQLFFSIRKLVDEHCQDKLNGGAGQSSGKPVKPLAR
jgi:hypothetical protein